MKTPDHLAEFFESLLRVPNKTRKTLRECENTKLSFHCSYLDEELETQVITVHQTKGVLYILSSVTVIVGLPYSVHMWYAIVLSVNNWIIVYSVLLNTMYITPCLVQPCKFYIQPLHFSFPVAII